MALLCYIFALLLLRRFIELLRYHFTALQLVVTFVLL